MDTRRETAMAVLKAALRAVDPAEAVRRSMARDDDTLTIGDRVYDLRRYRRVFVVGGGKASIPMSRAVGDILGDRLTAGILTTKRGHQGRGDTEADAGSRPVEIVEAGHPIPDEAGQGAAQRMAAMLRDASADDLVICLISGGGSALMALPAPGITLADKQSVTQALLACGATINEVNCVRKHLSLSKGGRFALLAQPAEVVTLILSDVVGSPLDVIASGPTVPDPSTFAEAHGILARYGILADLPAAVHQRIEQGMAGQVDETPAADHPAFGSTYNLVVADNRIAARAAAAAAEALGLRSLLLTTSLEGEAREVAKVLAALAREMEETGAPLSPPACLVAGGETTVTIRGKGKGGRNQEMALSAALKIAGLRRTLIMCAATDGSDGPTDAAGALVDGDTVLRARDVGMDPVAYLDGNNSYEFFDRQGGLIMTGPTNTNVNDLAVVFVF